MQGAMREPLFVVGTGRCGSTLISEFVRAHPELLSLSEVFSLLTDLGSRIRECFPSEPLDARELWSIIGASPPKLAAMLHHEVVMDEVLWRPSPRSRYTAATGVPALIQIALTHLGDSPEPLFDELSSFVATRPRAAIGEHYQAVFDWLSARLGRQRWVERSGGSLRIVRRLYAHFPNARFVHLVRDGRDCAISMSRHHGFRMALLAMQLTEILGVDPWESSERRHEADLPDEFEPFLPEHFDRRAFLAYETPLPLCAHYWSGELLAGLAELAEIPRERVLTVRYEDFACSAHATIARLFSFLGVHCDAAWIDSMAARLRPARSDWTKLPASEREALEDACQPGFEALAQWL
jgi:putative sulfotransferase